MCNLQEKAMLVSISISQWTARKKDREANQTVSQAYGSNEKNGHFSKDLIGRAALKDIQSIVSAARAYHQANTLPWKDEGQRILPAGKFFEYRQRITEFISQFESRVNQFIDNYDDLVNQARIDLNGLFKETDYPPKEKIRNLFGFKFSVNPLADPDDFRIAISQEDENFIRNQVKQDYKETIRAGMKDLFNRLYDVISDLNRKMGEEGRDGKSPIFRNSLIENVRELCDLLPGLNIAGDSNLDNLTEEIKRKICTLKPDNLREFKGMREQTKEETDQLLSRIAGYMGSY
jgi:hypothetical protein